MGIAGGRWIRFNLVGVMGFVLQTATLSLLVRGAGLATSVAVTLAVLVAVSHNFFWHEYFTWPERPRDTRFKRWLSFHLSTGIMSILSNVVVTMAVMAITGLPTVVSNVVAVAIVSLANFWVSDRLVFRQ
ncbi:MAG TPA: GtrA family protein [Vicinamibacterales bacterium]|jgi:putative flippase GtrA